MDQLVLLIRHGHADYKPGHLYGWTPGVNLSDAGREQSKKLAERLEDLRLTAIYSSPLERCVQTAQIVADARGMEVRLVEDIGEVRYGKWTGKSFRSLMKTKLWRTVQLTPSQARFPEGESILEMQRRGIDAVEAIRRKHRRGIIAVFSHADMIKAVVAHYLGLHLDLFQRIHVDTASVTAVGFYGSFPRVMRVGDTGDYDVLRPPKRSRKEASKS